MLFRSMSGRSLLYSGAVLLMCASVAAQAPPPATQAAPAPTPFPALKIGTRVGIPAHATYDDAGRRDPFVSLIIERPAAVATASDSIEARAKGLAGVSVVDAAVRGIITSGDKWIAIIAGPNGVMYLARTNDRLHDGSVRRIEAEAVTFLAKVQDVTGKTVSREVRKGLRAGAGEGR